MMTEQVTIGKDVVLKLVGLVSLAEYPEEFKDEILAVKESVKVALEAAQK